MKAFEELLKENEKRVSTYVRYRVSSLEDSKDILQEVFLSAFKKFDELKSEEAFPGWLMAIARNKINDYYREGKQDDLPFDETVAYPSMSINRTVYDSVYQTLRKLNDDEKRILYMYYWQNASVREIADKLQIPAGTVKSRLHKARKNFEEKYPKEDVKVKKLPKVIPDYTIREINEKPFKVKWNELMGWFLIPMEGNSIRWGIYDFPERTLSEQVDMVCKGKAEVHGIQGVKVLATEKYGRRKVERNFVAQLTDTHCRYLAESHLEDGVEKLYTFMDGEAFLNNWGFGEENIGNETNLFAKGKIKREGNTVTSDVNSEVMDVVGRYEVCINGKTYDTVCLMDIGTYDENTITEQYIDETGHTVLWRRFNKSNWRWYYDHHEEILDEKLKDNESITVNGAICYHWYDCITDHIL